MPEIVYILTNSRMDDLVKIGRTENLPERMWSLSSHSGVPVPFECYYACEVKNAVEVESRLHKGLGACRVNQRKEFFKTAAENVQALLEVHAIREVTPDDDIVDNEDDRNTLKKERKNAPVFNFHPARIKHGAKLSFKYDKRITATVAGDRKINFNGKVGLLNSITREILRKDFGINKRYLRGSEFWLYGHPKETLRERRLRMETQRK